LAQSRREVEQMTSAKDYRARAEALRKLAKETKDADEALAYNLRAVECDYLADELENGQTQQHGIEPPAPPPEQQQPAQQHQQVQQKKEDDD
jgi:hypothetical protein